MVPPSPMILVAASAIIAALGVGAAITIIAVARIERVHRPAGRFVDVAGGRLHVLELGPDTGEPPVVLLHGASGNLEDQRLTLGARLAHTRRVILFDRPGHGFSDRRPGEASPGRQAAAIAQALDRMGVKQAIIVGHSWSGAVASALALDFPDRVAALVLLAPVTHPWRGGIFWYNRVASTRMIGPLFARTIAMPLGLLLIGRAAQGVFLPQSAPPDYVRRAAVRLVLRPREFLANAQDMAVLKAFVAAQVPRYREIAAPTVIIAGDRDNTVSPTAHAQAVAALIPRAKLVILKGHGHMPHHAAPDAVIAAIEELAANLKSVPQDA
jgi:pimeloyl-ACP methyl ester carboxylesterase